ncbi:carbohydrate [Seminavis robusta]|uniref:Carbohydrate n=1 Tax=Seminavis robusta TaxID=568900 RepID=A0A9N8H5E9_9STRA|nr:carbohydrate [Seminavis robusta]|eukprot:Sro22_g015370.1 carbohydrate (339) ;mRNA; f:87527-88543
MRQTVFISAVAILCLLSLASNILSIFKLEILVAGARRRDSSLTRGLSIDFGRPRQGDYEDGISSEIAATRPHCGDAKKCLVDNDDYIYGNAGSWDAAPIVVESHKLVFFSIPKAGCTTFKMLFRRMMGKKNWRSQDGQVFLPHNPRFNGLRYLHEYTLEEANEIMTSPNYTRAVFVRDPKLRFLSAFLDKALSNGGDYIKKKCCPAGDCIEAAQTLEGFLDLVKWCPDEHWKPQSERMEAKYFQTIDFVGHLENAHNDTRRLLERIHGWEEFGKFGWGKGGDHSIFQSPRDAGGHATWSQWEIWKWYNQRLERKVEIFYSKDYSNPLFAFEKKNLVAY